jgi:ProP effector
MRKKEKLIAAEMRSVLVARFPLAFMPKGAWKKPLKIGIFDDILKRCPELNEEAVKFALIDYCNGVKYLRNMIANTMRVDLDGTPSSQITPDEQQHSFEKLERKRRNKQKLPLAAE